MGRTAIAIVSFLFFAIFVNGQIHGQGEPSKVPTLTVSAQPLHAGRISPMLYGGFIELLDDLVPGMWAEMLNDRNFEGVENARWWCYRTGEPNFCDRKWNESASWCYDATNPFNGTRSAKLAAKRESNANLTQSGLAVKKGMAYHFEGYFKADVATLQPKVLLRAQNFDGTWTVLGSVELSNPMKQWAKEKCEIVCSGTTDRAVFELSVTGSGDLWVDKLSLMPADNQKGWRADVTQAVKDARPSIIRWGGLIVDPGDYKWKKGIGSRDLRVPFKNGPWGRIDANDVGLDEFLQFCELVDAEPLICVSFTDGAESAGDLVEYCNGGSDTEWGRKRAENGHPSPYGVKYWQVGNERGDEEYIKGCLAIFQAIKEADANAIILSSFPSPELFQRAGQYLNYVCPHHYTPDSHEQKADFEHHYAPDISEHEANLKANMETIKHVSLDHEVKIGVTEWNITGGWWGFGRGYLMTLNTALYTGRYLNLLHRYSNVVDLACRSNMTNSFGSGMIQTNPAGLYLTPSYYVMKLYAEHSKPLPVKVAGTVEGVDFSACASEKKDTVCVFAVNTSSEPMRIRLNLGEYGADYRPIGGEVVCDTADRRQPDLMNHFNAPDRVRTVDMTVFEDGVMLPALSVAAIECAAR